MLDPLEEEGAIHEKDEPENGQDRSGGLPSTSEIRAINEARHLYKSNTFKAQLDLLLHTVRPQEYKFSSLERTLQKLYKHFTSLPSLSPVHPLEAAASLSRLISKNGTRRQKGSISPSVRIPYPPPFPPQSAAWTVAFEPPEAMNVVGSWANSHTVKNIDDAPFGVDVGVEMPARLFQEKDYRNFRGFHKRAFYLACLATSLVDSFPDFTVEYEATDGDVRMTTLLLSSCKDDSSAVRATIRIIPVLPDDASIPRHRLSPSQSNLRGIANNSSVDSQKDAEQLMEGLETPTPHYNNSLALSFAWTSKTRLLGTHRLVGMVPSFGDGLALLRIWANQRGYGAGHALGTGTGARNYCVAGFEGLGAWWACILEVLILGEEPFPEDGGGIGKKRGQRPSVGKGLSSYQLFRAALDFLARRDFQTEPVFMKAVEHGQRYSITEWGTQYDAIFVDATGTVNMLAGVPACSLELLRYDAASTLKLLNGPSDSFDSVFLTDMREPHTRFDTVISFNLANVRRHTSLDFPSSQMTLHNLVATVRKALNTRAHAVAPLQSRSSPYLVTTQPTSHSMLSLGIIFDPTRALRLVDHGPAASTAGVDEFRAFWGAKAELRRFKDGSIVESCVWDDGIVTMEDREGIPARIVRYILNHHFGIPEMDVCILAGDYGSVVSSPTVRGRRGESGYKNALAALDKFVRELKALEDVGSLPLTLVSAKPCSPHLRYTSVFPPSSIPSSSNSVHPSTSHLPAFEVVLQFERSSQWPDDLRAIQKVKLALFESIARGLSQRKGVDCQACVILDPNAAEIGDGCILEVVLDGWAFHARTGHDRELILLQDMMGRSTKRPHQPALSTQEQHAATHSLHIYRRRFIHAPAHHSAILALHHKLPAFSQTVRLVKRWLGAHWLSARVADEAIELICAKVFLSSEGDVPACGKRGFVRVAEYLKRWDGLAYVPLYEAISEVNAATPNKLVTEAGKGCWRLATAEDTSGTMWCEDLTIPVATRIREVARATIACLAVGTQTIKTLFQHPTTDYDFLIELDPHAISRYWEGVHASSSVWTSSKYVNLTSSIGDEPVRVAFNPAEMFFRDLQRAYGDTMELFYDIYGGTTIGGVWNPLLKSAEQQPWRVFLRFSSLPVRQGMQPKKGNTGVSLNAEGILLEIQRCGEGIVTKITTRD